MRDDADRKFTMTATPQDATVRVNMPVSEDAEASYDGPVAPAIVESSDGVPSASADAETRLERSWDGPAPDDARVEAIDADAPTSIVTPLEVGYRLSILKRLAEIAIESGIRPVAGHPAVSVAAIHGDRNTLAVEFRVLRWHAFASWFRALAIRDFIDLKSTLATFPPEIKLGARSLLRQLTDRTHEAWPDTVRTVTL